MVNWIFRVAVCAVFAVSIAACDDDDGNGAAEETTDESEAAEELSGDVPSEAPTGSDMQDLVDDCTEGDMAACDELYRDSPFGSDEEAWGDSCGGRQEVGTGQWCDE